MPVVRLRPYLPYVHQHSTYEYVLQFKFAKNPEVRQRAYEGYDSRLAHNAPLLDKALELRRKIAKLLGYATW